jgi:hypothetical protein
MCHKPRDGSIAGLSDPGNGNENDKTTATATRDEPYLVRKKG